VKALLVLAALLFGVWLWRQRGESGGVSGARKPPEALPQDMLRCRHCGLHLPANEAIAGAQGSYCCNEHRRLAES
jgi:uncharacterized protein